MSIAAVLPYFRTRINGLGHKEWRDALNFENIPETILDRAYHLDFNPTLGNGRNHTALDLNQDVTVRLFAKGYTDTSATRDRLISLAQEVICDIIDPRNSTIGPAVKNVEFSSMNIIPIDGSNDNTMYAEMNFSVRTFLEFT